MPQGVSSVAAFEHWRARAEREQPRLLYMSRSDLMRREPRDAGPARYPDEWAVGVHRLPLRYRFEPGAADDGVTLVVPEPLVQLLQADELAWLVPGLRLEQVTAIFRALPKALRKLLVPVPEHASKALTDISHLPAAVFSHPSRDGSRANRQSRRRGQPRAAEAAGSLRMNIRVVDVEDRVLAEGRDLALIRRSLRIAGAAAARPSSAAPGPLSEGRVPPSGAERRDGVAATAPQVGFRRAAADLRRWSAMACSSRCIRRSRIVSPEWRSSRRIASRRPTDFPRWTGAPDTAEPASAGEGHLAARRIRSGADAAQQGLAAGCPLARTLPPRIFREAFFAHEMPLPRSEAEFEPAGSGPRTASSDRRCSWSTLIKRILEQWRSIRVALENCGRRRLQPAVADIRAQLEHLLPPDFINSVPRPWLDHLPRYLQAIARRIERLPAKRNATARLAAQVQPFVSGMHELMANLGPRARLPELMQLRWMIEELRVSLFAQELKTALRVSAKRLEEQLQAVRAADEVLDRSLLRAGARARGTPRLCISISRLAVRSNSRQRSPR